MDWSWWAADPRERVLSDRIQAPFASEGRYGGRYALDGTRLDGGSRGPPTALVATNAVAGLAATDSARALAFAEVLWNADIPAGRLRYYDGTWYLMALLHLSGEYRIWTPAGLPEP